ncbi:Ribosomal RNA small subunit methyltransferase B [Alphaproteobacteria bacterium SO-S41]|nr:Ribosomal RNA small subunit methyltransferase B [Alphaproteobacteria bacterium SO-S41]
MLETRRKTLEAPVKRVKKPSDRPADMELLLAIRAWVSGRGGEMGLDDALSTAERPGRFRLKGALDKFFRHYARLTWLVEKQGLTPTPERLWGAAAVILDNADPREVAKSVAVTTADLQTIASLFGRISGDGLAHEAMPEAVRLECPPQLYPIFSDAFGPRLKQELTALTLPAPLDIRVNSLKSTPEALVEDLSKAGIELKPGVFAPLTLRVKGRPDLAGMKAFANGLFDMQDEGSQLVAAMTDAKPGQWVLDFCAGAGGKSLALAAGMTNRGHLIATDTNAKRLARAKLRFKRAGVENAERIELNGKDDDPAFKRLAGRFDRVLVDAPCSGTGAWRRHPETKWKGDHGLDRLVALQTAILARAAKMVKRGGRLTYATCSLLPMENEAQAAAFLKAHPGFKAVPAESVWTTALPGPWPCDQPDHLKLTPAQHGTDGFFATVFERVS